MSRNRAKHTHSLHWIGVLKWVLILGLLAVLGLVYMLGKNQNMHLAQETYRLQENLNSINQRNEDLGYYLEQMKSPRALERRLAQMHSSLVRLDQMNSPIVTMDSGTRMLLERKEAVPPAISNVNLSTTRSLNLNPPVAATGATDDTPASPAGSQ